MRPICNHYILISILYHTVPNNWRDFTNILYIIIHPGYAQQPNFRKHIPPTMKLKTAGAFTIRHPQSLHRAESFHIYRPCDIVSAAMIPIILSLAFFIACCSEALIGALKPTSPKMVALSFAPVVLNGISVSCCRLYK